MIEDAKEHICSGCHEIIATHEPEAYQEGAFYYHSKAHERLHVSRNWNNLLKNEGENSHKAFRELALIP